MRKEIEEFLDILNIPEDERDFVLGIQTDKLPEKYEKAREELLRLGVVFEMYERLPEHFKPFAEFEEAKDWLENTKEFIRVEIPDGLGLTDPMPICCFTKAPTPGNHHINLRFGARSKATVVVGSTVPKITGDSEIRSNMELNVGEEAEVNLVILNSFRKETEVFPLVRGKIGHGAKINMTVVNLFNGNKHSSDYQLIVGDRVDVKLNVISFSRNSDRVEDSYKITLKGKKSHALLSIRGVSRDSSYQRHIAVIEADTESEKSEGIADTAGFLLQDESKFEVWPSLIVKNDDIHLDHQAYVGHIPDETIEYLRSRGFTREGAMFLIVHSMIAPLKSYLPPRFQDEIEKIARLLVENKIPEI